MWGAYVLEDLWADTESGHNIEKTVFIDCRSGYRQDGPEHLRPIGETEFIAAVAAKSAKREGAATIAGIVSHANLLLGDAVEEVLAAHEEAGNGLFRGIRHAGPHDTTGTLTNAGRGSPCPYGDEDFRTGMRRLGQLGYTYDTWHFYHQNRDYLALARAVPDTTMILDHFGTPLGVGAYAGRQEEIFAQWQEDASPCPTTGSAGTGATPHPLPTNSSKPNGATTCTPSSASDRTAACSRATFQWTGCRSPTT